MSPPTNPSRVFLGQQYQFGSAKQHTADVRHHVIAYHQAIGNGNLCEHISHSPSMRAKCSADLPDNAFKNIVNEIVPWHTTTNRIMYSQANCVNRRRSRPLRRLKPTSFGVLRWLAWIILSHDHPCVSRHRLAVVVSSSRPALCEGTVNLCRSRSRQKPSVGLTQEKIADSSPAAIEINVD